MTALNIYSLDDQEGESVLASLPVGTHIIGRGDLLQVTDKRVSRKHAVIKVFNDRITITSVHVNPCFFKAAGGNTLIVIPQNQENELSDGDQFALLPENYWFKVKIKKEQNDFGDTLDNSNKRLHENNHEDTHVNTNFKKAKLLEEPCTSYENNSCSSHITSPQKLESHETSRESTDDKSILQNIVNNLNTSHNDKNAGTSEVSLECLETFNQNQDIKKEPPDIENIKTETSQSTSQEVPNTSSNFNNLKGVLKDGPLDHSNEEQPHSSLQGSVPKDEPNDNIDEQPNAETANDNLHEDKVKDEPSDENDAQPSSGTPYDNESKGSTKQKKTRRERCWYGDRCFRKNPNHREDFSHPGDQDYESDPEDDRPDCPYGAACYRKNIEHRREYKHVGKPAPKPSNVNVTLNVSNGSGCPFCSHCQNKKSHSKDDYESDVDEDY